MHQEVQNYQQFLLNKLEFKISERSHEQLKAQLVKIRKDIAVDYESYKNDLSRLKRKVYYPYTILE